MVGLIYYLDTELLDRLYEQNLDGKVDVDITQTRTFRNNNTFELRLPSFLNRFFPGNLESGKLYDSIYSEIIKDKTIFEDKLNSIVNVAYGDKHSPLQEHTITEPTLIVCKERALELDHAMSFQEDDIVHSFYEKQCIDFIINSREKLMPHYLARQKINEQEQKAVPDVNDDYLYDFGGFKPIMESIIIPHRNSLTIVDMSSSKIAVSYSGRMNVHGGGRQELSIVGIMSPITPIIYQIKPIVIWSSMRTKKSIQVDLKGLDAEILSKNTFESIESIIKFERAEAKKNKFLRFFYRKKKNRAQPDTRLPVHNHSKAEIHHIDDIASYDDIDIKGQIFLDDDTGLTKIKGTLNLQYSDIEIGMKLAYIPMLRGKEHTIIRFAEGGNSCKVLLGILLKIENGNIFLNELKIYGGAFPEDANSCDLDNNELDMLLRQRLEENNPLINFELNFDIDPDNLNESF